jgi:predicted metalloprotease with PDZ domain
MGTRALLAARPSGLVCAAVAIALADAIPARAAPVPPPRVEYSVRAGEGARELRVEASFASRPGRLVLGDGMGRHLRDAEARSGGSWVAATLDEDAVEAPSCLRGPCRVRYRFLLDEAARGSRDRMSAFEQGGALVATPATWLARPVESGELRYRLRVTTPPGISFATGLFPSGPDTYEARLDDLPEAPYSAFGPFQTTRVPVAGGEIELAVLPGEIPVDRAAVLAWVERAGADVAAYYDRLPVPRVLVIVVPGGRRAVGYGTTMGNGGASIMIWLGASARAEDLTRDWVLTHEMVHLGLPNLPRAQRWMEEGLATYVEPIARARRGHLGMEEVWSDLVRRTPQGVPGAGGLDAAQGFGPIYWGGALFWLLADVEIRERTGNRRSLEDALRAVRDAGGSIAVTWPVARVLSTADRALGVQVLGPLFGRMARSGDGVDLPALWSRLGIDDRGGIRFRDDAPLAGIRKAITAPPRPSAPAGGR